MKADEWAGLTLALLLDMRQIDAKIYNADDHLQKSYKKLLDLLESLLLFKPLDGENYMLDALTCLDCLIDALYPEPEFDDPVKRFDKALGEFWDKW